METELLSNTSVNVRSLRDMWSEKVKQEEKLLKQKLTAARSYSIKPSKLVNESEVRSLRSIESIASDKESNFTPSNDFKTHENSSCIHEVDESWPLPVPPPLVVLQQVPTNVTVQESVINLFDADKDIMLANRVKNSGIRHWHLARHVFRSGLLFSPARRASDSMIPILMKARLSEAHHRTKSVDNMPIYTPFEMFIDYISQTYDDDETMNCQMKRSTVKRRISDTMICIQRNKLNDIVAQYEAIVRRLKNYDKFMAMYPMVSSSISAQRSSNNQDIKQNNEEYFQETLSGKIPIRCSQTQSLSRNVGRTFTDFVINDLLLSQKLKASPNISPSSSFVNVASQTDSYETDKNIDTVPLDEINHQVTDELNEVLVNTDQSPQITPNTEINVIIVNSADVPQEPVKPAEIPLMQRLFEGKKSAYTPDDLHMEAERITEELLETYKEAKKTCFLSSERVLYATKVMKLDRRGYKQRLRILAITTERLYIITKKNPYPKEFLAFKNVLGVTCTPYKDGFVCIKTREIRDDRGDWIFLANHPCECITKLFIALKRDNNDDNFLKIEAKFKHTRRAPGILSEDGLIEARLSTEFRMKYENYVVFAIYTP